VRNVSNKIVNNHALDGGEIHLREFSSPNIMNCKICKNLSTYGGGVHCISFSNPKIINCLISKNSTEEGGSIYCRYESSPIIINSTIVENNATSGGGIHCSEGSGFYLTNCILWNDSQNEIYFQENGNPNNITVSYTDVQGGENGIATNDNGMVNWLEGNINADPLFTDPESANFTLQQNSPCIDAGDPDLDGDCVTWEYDPDDQDPDGTRMDMGALYFDHRSLYPAAPRNLYAIPSNQQVTLRWNPNTESDLHKYNIYRDTTSPATTLIDSVVGTPPDTFYIDTGLTNGQIYYYRVKAVDDAGNESDFSNEVITTPPNNCLADSPWPKFRGDSKNTGQSQYIGPQTDRLKWSYQTGSAIYSSPAIGSDGTVYIGSWDHKLYAINSDGSLKWSYLMGDNISSSPAIGSDGTVYMGSVDKKLYAFQDLDEKDPTVTLSSTLSGEVLYCESKKEIRWEASDDIIVSNIALYYSIDNGLNYIPIDTTEVNDSSYTWTIPNTPSSKCKVKIIARDGVGNTANDISDGTFTITDTTKPLVQVISPNGGEMFGIGLTDTIKFAVSDNVGVSYYKIFFSSDNGISYQFMDSLSSIRNSYIWNVPILFSNECLVKIIAADSSGNIGEDISNSAFEITDLTVPEVALLKPNGGEEFVGSLEYTIEWTASDN